MTNRTVPLLSFAMMLLLLAGGCVTQPPIQKAEEDARIDIVVSQLDKSLANQATANAQLQAQQQQLESQAQDLAALNRSLGKALNVPEPVECPKAVACPPVPESSNKMVVGGLEEVWFPDLGLELTARIDTGSATASLHARDIEQFERDGKRWVRFTIINPKTATPVTLERRLVRTVAIFQPGAVEAKRRPVVKLVILIGEVEQTSEFSLSDRNHADYRVKIGRNILKDVMVVDVSKKNVAPYVRPDKKPDANGAAQ